MANVKISQLPSWTGSQTDLRWFVMNNSGETETFKFSGYSSQLIPGTGADSYRTPNATASGTNAVAIGNGAIADGNNSVNIGNSTIPIGPGSVCIGKHYNSGNYSINIGGGAYNYGTDGIAIGYETSSQNGGIAIGSNTTRAGGVKSISLGHAIEQNLGTNSVVIGYDNRAGLAGTFNGNPYGVIIGSGHRVETPGFYNSILGGANNALTGNTTGSTLINTTGITKVGSWDIIIGGNGNNYDNSGYTNNVSIGGESNVMTGTRGFKTIINGFDNKILNNAKWAQIFGGYSNTIDGGDYGLSIIGGFNNTINSSTYGAGILSAFYSTMNQCGTSVLVGGVGNTISNSNAGGIFGGRSCSLTNSFEDIGASIWGAWNATITAGSPLAQIIGGNSTTISSTSQYSTILNGETQLIDNSPYSQILGGSGNTINCELPALERYNNIIGGYGNTIFDTGDEQKLQTIINSIDTTLSNGVERVTAIGLSGRTINDAQSGTTYVENLKAFRQIASSSYDNGSVPQAGYTIDLRNGDKQEITITGSAGNTNLYYTGNLAGGRLVLKVINTSTGNIGFADNAPYTWRLPATMNPQTPNGTDIYVFESFDNQNLWLVSHTQNLS